MIVHDSRKEVCLAGVGGQGLALAGQILAEAAGIYDGRHVLQTDVHGVSSRGGHSRSEVILSDEEIDYPGIRHLDVLLAMTQAECDRFAGLLKEDGVLVADSTNVTSLPAIQARSYTIPLTQLAREEVGSVLSTNIVALAAISVLTGVVSREALEKAVLARTPAKLKEVNRRALEVGFKSAMLPRGIESH